MNDPARDMACWRVPVAGVSLQTRGARDIERRVSVAPVITADTVADARGRARKLYPHSKVGWPELIHGRGGHANPRSRS